MACRTSEPLAEEPYGFIACALLFEMTRTLEPYFRGDICRSMKEYWGEARGEEKVWFGLRTAYRK
jgi:hypothetical protein